MFTVIKCSRMTVAMAAKITRIRARRAADISSTFSTCPTQRAATVEPVDLTYSVYDEHSKLATHDGVPVIVSHGLFGSRNNWHSLAKALNKTTRRKIIAIDLRCHGSSPHHNHDEHLDNDILSEDILHLVTGQLRLNKAALIGHSLGGIASLYAAIKRPDLIECVISVDVSLERFKKPENQQFVKFIDAMLAAKWDPTLSLSAVRRLVDTQLEDSVQITSIRQWLLTNLIHDGTKVRWSLDLHTLRKNYARLFTQCDIPGIYSSPTLYLSGADSNYVEEKDHGPIRSRFPQAKFMYIPGAGHWVHSSKPQEFLEIASRFLDDVSTRSH